MDSDYCYGIEMQRAMERHEQGEAQVIPVILSHVHWQEAPFGKLQALPTDAKPVTGADWHSLNEALFDVVEGVRKAIEGLTTQLGFTLIRTLINFTKEKHIEAIFSVAISPDGQTLVSGSYDATIKVWNLRTGQLLRTLSGHSSQVSAVAISPDGKFVISGSEDKTIKVWNLHKGQSLRTLSDHSEIVWSIAISPDGQTFASGGGDRVINVWRLRTGQLLCCLQGHSDSVSGVTISFDGHVLVSSGFDKTIKIWEKSSMIEEIISTISIEEMPQEYAKNDEDEGPPLVTPDADPDLSDFVEAIEKDLLLEMMQDIQNDQIWADDAQKIAQELLAFLPISDKQDMSDKLGILAEKYTGALRVYKKYFPNLGADIVAMEHAIEAKELEERS